MVLPDKNTESKSIVLKFPRQLVDKPIIYHLVKDYDLQFNIIKASVTPEEEGLVVMELAGKKKDYEAGIKFLKDQGVKVEFLEKDIRWLEDKCTQCSACITVCPTQALYIDRKTMLVGFDKAKCIGCELCVSLCPPRAIEVHF